MLLDPAAEAPRATAARSVGLAAHRIAALDMLRALAVLLVLGHHAAWRFRPGDGDAVGQMLKGSGWIGVDIFFVISGFMITQVLLRDRGDVRGFFVRRFFRIVPIFAVAIACFVALTLATGIGVEKLRLIWSPALLLNGWTIPFYGYGTVPYTITWSLSVEETAYVILGLACLRHAAGLRRALVALLLLATAVRIAVWLGGWVSLSELYFFVPARLDSIALGGLLSLGLGSSRPPRWLAPVSGAAMFAMVWAFQFTTISHPGVVLAGYTVFGLVAGLFVSSLAQGGPRSEGPRSALQSGLGFAGRAVARFGRLSYFVYLFHIFVLEALLRAHALVPGLRLGFWPATLLAVAIVFAMAAVSWKYFEFPLIQYGKRISTPVTRPA